MSDHIKVFFIEPTDKERRWLRRYSLGVHPDKHYCQAMRPLGDFDKSRPWDDYKREEWPTACDSCSHPFKDTDEFQKFDRTLYTRKDTGEMMTLQDAPPGACWNAHWYVDHEYNRGKMGSGYNTGPDGRCLVVKLPDGHDWIIDSRCSNCTKPDNNEHFCWVRHGRPEDGTLHVDKKGDTCSAGAGSIATPNWHGFLHNGYLHT